MSKVDSKDKYIIDRHITKYITVGGLEVMLYRIKALRDIHILGYTDNNISNFTLCKAGEYGGYIQSERNLSQGGECWVAGNACVCENATVKDMAYISGESVVHGNAVIYNDAIVLGQSKVYGNAEVYESASVVDSKIHGESTVHENASVSKSEIYGEANVYGSTLVEKSVVSGAATVRGIGIKVTDAWIDGMSDIRFVWDYMNVKGIGKKGLDVTIQNSVLGSTYVSGEFVKNMKLKYYLEDITRLLGKDSAGYEARTRIDLSRMEEKMHIIKLVYDKNI